MRPQRSALHGTAVAVIIAGSLKSFFGSCLAFRLQRLDADMQRLTSYEILTVS